MNFKARPAHFWFVPIYLFALSMLRWSVMVGVLTYRGDLEWRVDRCATVFVYLPMLAAFLGISFAMSGAYFLWRSSMQKNLLVLLLYSLIFLSWGVTDIYYHHRQEFRCSVAGEIKGAGEHYWTWWFIPHSVLPQYQPNKQA